MPDHCEVCAHPDRETIDRALLANASAHALATTHNLPYSEILIHQRNHLGHQNSPRYKREDSNASFLLHRLDIIFRETARIFHEAALGDFSVALRAAQRLEHQLELMARFFPAAGDSETLLPSERRIIRTVMDEALVPYPEARLALADALSKVQFDAA